MKIKILYIMHVDWNWIKQRPQFLAEHLSTKYNIKVIFPSLKKSNSYKRAGIFHEANNNIKFATTFQVPLRGRIKIIGLINDLLNRIFFWLNRKLFKPDLIWITYPTYNSLIPKSDSYKIIYDCMDDAQNFFTEDIKMREWISQQEISLLKKSDAIIVSSKNLYDVVGRKAKVSKKLHLVRNAFGGDIINVKKDHRKISDKFKIGYVGTISKWFDFEAIKHAAEKIDGIEFHLIGPVENSIPTLPQNIFLHGPVNHSDIYDRVEQYDCLIMPFKINDLILSVDPVKLYEYINFDKPIICINYPEVIRFNKFVSFYNDKESLVNTIMGMIGKQNHINKKYSTLERLNFLEENNWTSRLKDLNRILDSL